MELFREWHSHAAAIDTASLLNSMSVSNLDDDGFRCL
jgi:hypothetical protein